MLYVIICELAFIFRYGYNKTAILEKQSVFQSMSAGKRHFQAVKWGGFTALPYEFWNFLIRGEIKCADYHQNL